MTVTCPVCGDASIGLKGYLWTHLHPWPWGRRVGIALMVVGGFTVGVSLLELFHLVK